MQLLLNHQRWFWLLTFLYISVNVFLLANNIYYGLFAPVVFAVILVGIYRFDWLIMLTAMLTPLSFRFNDIGYGVGLDMPSDLLILFLGGIVIFKFFADGQADLKIIKHPITLAIFINLGWILFTSITSSMPLVSIKYLLSRFLYVIVFYFALTHIFKNLDKIKLYFWVYILPFAGVIIYTLIQHSEYNFDQRASYAMSQPFYINHGIYSIPIAFFVPFLIAVLANGHKLNYSLLFRTICIALLGLFLVGLIYSYTRAAWVSLLAALGLAFILYFRFKWYIYAGGILIVLVMAYSMRERLQLMLHKNKQVSADNLEQHVKSIYNISNDDSNLERINRWRSALRMTAERPWVGFGAGTYKFQYAPFQRAKELTKISTNFGTVGNAHSEYFQPLAELGVIGLLSFLYLLFVVGRTAVKLHYKSPDPKVRVLNMAALLGLTTYFVHGLLNNYSDQDKAAILIWGFIAMIAALDIYHDKKTKLV